MKDTQKLEKILDYSYRKSVFQVQFGHPSHFDEYVSFKEELDLGHLTELELIKEFHKLIFHSILRTYKILNEITLKESEIFFKNFEK
jgi:hypothetical protein